MPQRKTVKTTVVNKRAPGRPFSEDIVKKPARLREKETEVWERMNQLIDVLQSLRTDKFTGYVKINFSQGSLGRVEKFEEILKR